MNTNTNNSLKERNKNLPNIVSHIYAYMYIYVCVYVIYYFVLLFFLRQFSLGWLEIHCVDQVGLELIGAPSPSASQMLGL